MLCIRRSDCIAGDREQLTTWTLIEKTLSINLARNLGAAHWHFHIQHDGSRPLVLYSEFTKERGARDYRGDLWHRERTLLSFSRRRKINSGNVFFGDLCAYFHSRAEERDFPLPYKIDLHKFEENLGIRGSRKRALDGERLWIDARAY